MLGAQPLSAHDYFIWHHTVLDVKVVTVKVLVVFRCSFTSPYGDGAISLCCLYVSIYIACACARTHVFEVRNNLSVKAWNAIPERIRQSWGYTNSCIKTRLFVPNLINISWVHIYVNCVGGITRDICGGWLMFIMIGWRFNPCWLSSSGSVNLKVRPKLGSLFLIIISLNICWLFAGFSKES